MSFKIFFPLLIWGIQRYASYVMHGSQGLVQKSLGKIQIFVFFLKGGWFLFFLHKPLCMAVAFKNPGIEIDKKNRSFTVYYKMSHSLILALHEINYEEAQYPISHSSAVPQPVFRFRHQTLLRTHFLLQLFPSGREFCRCRVGCQGQRQPRNCHHGRRVPLYL